jgi:phage regulator Rha-like protein
MFQLTQQEFRFLRPQFVTSKGRGGRRYLPYAFTEHGVIMAANVLNSERAVQTSVRVVRTFVKLRQILLANTELAGKTERA